MKRRTTLVGILAGVTVLTCFTNMLLYKRNWNWYTVNGLFSKYRGCTRLKNTLGNRSRLHHNITLNLTEPSLEELQVHECGVQRGGRYKPNNDTADRVAIIIPYRDRESHLKVFLRNIHTFLQDQNLDYGIYVIEMDKNISFNRGLLNNVGFIEASKLYDYQCFVFHDVDMLPEDDRIMYTCPNDTRHMSSANSKFGFRMPYKHYFGGVTSLTKRVFAAINGYSNKYFGWGGEDDDLYIRVKKKHFNVDRYDTKFGRYHALGHEQAKPNPKRNKLVLTASKRTRFDGINTVTYQIVTREFKSLYTWFLVKVNERGVLSKKDKQTGI